MEKLYTVIYSFFSATLGLSGLAKETFAVIFSFWLNAKRNAVEISLTVFQNITGGSRPAIVAAIKLLEDRQYINISRTKGLRSRYYVTIDPQILDEFDVAFSEKVVNSVNHTSVKPPNQGEFSDLTRPGKLPQPHNKHNEKRNQLIVPPRVEKGHLKEV